MKYKEIVKNNSSVVDLIKNHEGLRLNVYQCIAGKNTIGYGRNLDDNGISKDEADMMLQNDVQDTIISLERYRWFSTLNSTRRMAMIDMTFNLGLTRLLRFKKMIAALNVSDYTEASKQMLDSRWSKQVGRRAVTLSNMMANGRD
jgi:lysozyme